MFEEFNTKYVETVEEGLPDTIETDTVSLATGAFLFATTINIKANKTGSICMERQLLKNNLTSLKVDVNPFIIMSEDFITVVCASF